MFSKSMWRSGGLSSRVRRVRGRLGATAGAPRFESLEQRVLLSSTLLDIDPEHPQISFDSGGTVGYDPGTQLFEANATPFAFRLSDVSPPRVIQTPREMRLSIQIDHSGALVGGVPGDDLIVTGSVDADGDGSIDYTGVLLTGEILAYGALDSGSVDQYDFRFAATGGALVDAGLYAGKDIGVLMNSLNSSFTDNFAVSFGGSSEGRIGPIERDQSIPAALGDFVWEDRNADGIQDAGEPGIEGVTVKLIDAGGNVIDTTMTDASGLYLFDELVPGDYAVMFVAPAGYMVSPRDQGGDDAVDSDANPADGMTQFVNLESGETDLTLDAGLFRKAALGDFVWEDLDHDGQQDAGEPGVAGVIVHLHDGGGAIIDTTVTDGTGLYLFDELIPGDYKVTFELPAGFEFTLQNVGDDATDSDADPVTGMSHVTNLESGETDLTLDAGLVRPTEPAIHLEKYTRGVVTSNPQDGDICETIGKPTELTFRYTGDGQDATNTAQPEGKYIVTGDPNDATPVRIVASSQGTFSSVNAGNSYFDGIVNIGQTFTMDVDNATSETSFKANTYIYIVDGQGVVLQLVQYHTSCSAPIVLGDQIGSLHLEGAVGPNGSAALPPQDNGGVGELGEDADDPTGPQIMLGDQVIWTYVVTNPGELPLLNVVVVDDAETPGDPSDDFLPAAVLDDMGFNVGDVNQDGLLDVDEAWIFRASDYVTELGQHRNDAKVTANDSFGRMVMDDDPSHHIGLCPNLDVCASGQKPRVLTMLYTGDGADANSHNQSSDKVAVTGDPNDAPVVFIRASDKANPTDGRAKVWFEGNVNLGESFDIDATNGGATKLSADTYVHVFDLAGNLLQTIRFHTSCSQPLAIGNQFGAVEVAGFVGEFGATGSCILPPGALGDFVWHDLDGNGQQDADEPGVEGVLVELHKSNGSFVGQMFTDADGGYLFTQLPKGQYKVTFTLPVGFRFTGANVGGDDAADSDADLITGMSQVVFLDAGETNRTIDAGLVSPAALGDFVWEDLDRDGVQDAGEPGVAGIKVTLTGAGPDGVLGTADDTMAMQFTDAGGGYLFDDLAPGAYKVTFTAPAEFRFTDANRGGDDAADSDADAITGMAHGVSLVSGQTDLSVDAGLIRRLEVDVQIEKYTRAETVAPDPGDGDVCLTIGKPTEMTFRYTGDGPDATNTAQAVGKYSVTGDPNDASPVRIVASKEGDFTRVNAGNSFFDGMVNLGETFTIDVDNAADLTSFGANTYLFILDAQGVILQRVGYHTSCSTPIVMGDQVGSLHVEGAVGPNGSVALPPQDNGGLGDLGEDADDPTGPQILIGDGVVWTYVVTNPGLLPLSNVMVVDDAHTPANPADDFMPAPILTAAGWNIGDLNENGLLDADEAWAYRASGTVAEVGQHRNIGKVIAQGPAGQMAMDTDPSHHVGVQPHIDVCAVGQKARVVTMLYTGDGPDATQHSQDPTKVTVTGDPNDAPTVRILATNKANPSDAAAKVFFDGEVDLGERFDIDATRAGDSRLPADSYVHVFSPSGDLLQTVRFHTSCSQPLFLGDQFGSVEVIGFVGEQGATVGVTGPAPAPAPVPIMGDVNADGHVDVIDLSTLAKNFGKTDALWSDGDLNGDMRVDIGDLSLVALHFGRSAGQGGGSAGGASNGADVDLLEEVSVVAANDDDDPDASGGEWSHIQSVLED